MHAAIYARKSTEQRGVAEAAKSVTQQIEGARAFISKQGLSLNDAHIFSDDAISGAEFERRAGLQRLLAFLRPRAPFQMLVVRELARLGRESVETGYVIKQLAEAGVEVIEYIDGKSLTPKNWLEKAMFGIQSAADEAHREDASKAVTKKHNDMHQDGYVTGGRVFGYINQDVFDGVDVHGRPLRSHVIRVIDPVESEVVRLIFRLYDSGLGLKAIARRLKGEGAQPPKPFKTKTGLAPVTGWAPSTIRSVLTRELYHGWSVRNKTKKKNAWGKLQPHKIPESGWDRVHLKHLQIIDDALWARVQARRRETEGKAVRFESGRISGRPPRHAVQNLLAGLATCGLCGGGLVVEHSNNKKGKYSYYECARRRHHGSDCTNRLRIPVGEMNEAVLQAVEEHALTPEAIEQVIQLTERDDARDQQMTLTRERKDIEKRIKRLVAAVETAGDVSSLAAKLRELEARRNAIDRDLRTVQPLPRLAAAVIENRLTEWRRLLRSSTTQARAVLQRVLQGRIVFSPDGDRYNPNGYTFEAPTRFDKLFAGVVAPRPSFIPTGNKGAEQIGPEDTWDGDYGRLLEHAYGVYGVSILRHR